MTHPCFARIFFVGSGGSSAAAVAFTAAAHQLRHLQWQRRGGSAGHRQRRGGSAGHCHRHLQMKDHRSIPTIGCQSRSPAPLSPPPHHPLIPFTAVQAPLEPASLPSVVNRVKMWPLGQRLALRDSGLMPMCRLLALLSPPHLRPLILLAAVRTLLPSASTPPVVIFV